VAVIRKHRLPASWRHLVPGAFVAGNLVLAAALAISSFLAASSGKELLSRLWLTSWAVYLCLALAAGVSASRRDGWRLLPLLPAVFVTFHSAYGLGFLTGLLCAPRPGTPAAPAESVFTALSR